MFLSLPQWLTTLILAVVMIATTEVAYQLTRRSVEKRPELKAGGEGVGFMLSGALALLGLLVGFTFAMAADRYDARRLLVNDEANALSTAYLRSRLAVGPDAATLPGLWADYAESRFAFQLGMDPDRIRPLLDEGDALRARIWAATRRETIVAPNDITANLVDATNEAFDVGSSRQSAIQARVPATIIWSVILYAVVASAILGQALVADQRRRVMSSILLGLVALSIGLILELNRPNPLVKVSQAPLERTMKMIRGMQAADRAAPPTPAPVPAQ